MYQWVPAGSIPANITGVKLYIKWRRKPNAPLSAEVDDKERSWLYGPDRIVCICPSQYRRRGTAVQAEPPEDFSYDVMIDTDIYAEGGLGEKYLEYTLISAHTGLSMHLYDNKFNKSKKIKILGDSGGAQLKFCSANFLDPYQIIEWHNRVPWAGFSLDISPRPVDRYLPKTLDACAYASKKTNQIFLKNKKPELKLINVNHGFTLEDVRRWAAIVHEPDGFYGWAAGADNSESYLGSLRSLFVTMLEFNYDKTWTHEYGKPIPGHYHLFGTGGSTVIPAYSWIGKHIETFTTDSTTHLSSVRYCALDSLAPDGRLNRTHLGRKSQLNSNILSPIQSNNEIAFAIGYWQFFAMDAKYLAQSTLAWNNMVTNLQYMQLWNTLAERVPLDDYLALVKKVSPNPTVTIPMIQYAEEVFKNGLDYAEGKFKAALGNDAPSDSYMHKPAMLNPESKSQKKKTNNYIALSDKDPTLMDILPRYLTREELNKFGLQWESPKNRTTSRKGSKYPESPIVLSEGMTDLYPVAKLDIDEEIVDLPEEQLEKELIEDSRVDELLQEE